MTSTRWVVFALCALTISGCVSTSSSTIAESTYGPTTAGPSTHRIIANNRVTPSKNVAAVEKDAHGYAKQKCPAGYVVQSQKSLPNQYFTATQTTPSIVLEWQIQCTAEPRGTVEGVGAIVVESLTAGNSDTVFFDMHAVTLAAPFATAYAAALNVLKQRGNLIWETDERKGTIITAATKFGVVGRPYYDQFFIAFDSVSANETKMTFKLFSHWRDVDAGDPPLMKPHAREAVYGRAAAFIDAVKAAVAKR